MNCRSGIDFSHHPGTSKARAADLSVHPNCIFAAVGLALHSGRKLIRFRFGTPAASITSRPTGSYVILNFAAIEMLRVPVELLALECVQDFDGGAWKLLGTSFTSEAHIIPTA